VIELLERSLERAFQDTGYDKSTGKGTFSMMTILLIIDQMLSRLESIHALGVVH